MGYIEYKGKLLSKGSVIMNGYCIDMRADGTGIIITISVADCAIYRTKYISYAYNYVKQSLTQV